MNSDVKLVYFIASTYGTDTCLCGTNVAVSEKKTKKLQISAIPANDMDTYRKRLCFGIWRQVTG